MAAFLRASERGRRHRPHGPAPAPRRFPRERRRSKTPVAPAEPANLSPLALAARQDPAAGRQRQVPWWGRDRQRCSEMGRAAENLALVHGPAGRDQAESDGGGQTRERGPGPGEGLPRGGAYVNRMAPGPAVRSDRRAPVAPAGHAASALRSRHPRFAAGLRSAGTAERPGRRPVSSRPPTRDPSNPKTAATHRRRPASGLSLPPRRPGRQLLACWG